MNTIDQRIAVMLLDYWQDTVPADLETAHLCRALVAKVAPHLLPQVMMSGNASRMINSVLAILQVLVERDQMVQAWLDQLQAKILMDQQPTRSPAELTNPQAQHRFDAPTRDVQQTVRGNGNLIAANDLWMVHFYGFGRLVNGEAALLLDDVIDGKRWLSVSQFAPLLGKARLVVLHACQSEHQTEQNSLISVAAALSQLRVPAVIALQSSIALPAGRLFLAELYRWLAAGQTIQQAMIQARLALYTFSDPSLHWYVPMLLLSTPTADSVRLIEH